MHDMTITITGFDKTVLLQKEIADGLVDAIMEGMVSEGVEEVPLSHPARMALMTKAARGYFFGLEAKRSIQETVLHQDGSVVTITYTAHLGDSPKVIEIILEP